ncbi:hypothetical protein B0H15DRAFT_188184 [Mycena belliarum]|uniref:Diaminopimelate epimerase-like protein n=1 Tax=Mycena belliarum TaxID=1033014 RepID=A0AAD6UJU7_9AGAR|nr:hypothetical protein B0H15DRAFT_188184 [Mycena belliae]
MARSFPFNVVAAFSTTPFQGNPAAVVFVDDTLETETLRELAAILNQPMTSVVGPRISSENERVAAFGMRWFTASSKEVSLCGHATMAAARAIFERGLVGDSVEVIEFHTSMAGVMKARKVGTDSFEICLPSGMLAEVPSAEVPKIRSALTEAFGRDVSINFIGVGREGFTPYLLVELDEQENLGQCTVNMDAFLETGYAVNILTTNSSAGDVQFVSRMFAPLLLPPPFSEDAVCGSAHCLLVPYWSKKKGLESNNSFRAKQVSARGGDLGLLWNQGANSVEITGNTHIIVGGDVYV